MPILKSSNQLLTLTNTLTSVLGPVTSGAHQNDIPVGDPDAARFTLDTVNDLFGGGASYSFSSRATARVQAIQAQLISLGLATIQCQCAGQPQVCDRIGNPPPSGDPYTCGLAAADGFYNLLFPLGTFDLWETLVVFSIKEVGANGNDKLERVYLPDNDQQLLADRAIILASQAKLDDDSRNAGLDRNSISIVSLLKALPDYTTYVQGMKYLPIDNTGDERELRGGYNAWRNRGGFLISQAVATGQYPVAFNQRPKYATSYCYCDPSLSQQVSSPFKVDPAIIGAAIALAPVAPLVAVLDSGSFHPSDQEKAQMDNWAKRTDSVGVAQLFGTTREPSYNWLPVNGNGSGYNVYIAAGVNGPDGVQSTFQRRGFYKITGAAADNSFVDAAGAIVEDVFAWLAKFACDNKGTFEQATAGLAKPICLTASTPKKPCVQNSRGCQCVPAVGGQAAAIQLIAPIADYVCAHTGFQPATPVINPLAPLPLAATPWWKTPIGVGAIVLGGVGIALVATKKPSGKR